MKFLKIVKKHKILIIVIVVALTLLISGYMLLRAFIPSGDSYGNRLKGIEKVALTEKEKDALVKKINDKDNVKNASINIKGRLINIYFETTDDTDIDNMKDYAGEISDSLDKDELAYYDIQFYVVTDKGENKYYPAIGYRHKGNDVIRWATNS